MFPEISYQAGEVGTTGNSSEPARLLEGDPTKPIADVQNCADSADADLARNIRLYLNANRNGFRRIGVSAEMGTVRLSGLVGSFFLRQMAVATTKRVAGVRQVIDDLEVDLETAKTCSNTIREDEVFGDTLEDASAAPMAILARKNPR